MQNLTKKITRKFNEDGYELYEIGGCVRDSIIGRKSNDIDLVTNAVPEKIKHIISEFGTIYDIGEKFGTVGLCIDNQIIEITTYRKEAYSDSSRKPNVVFTHSLKEDLSRRDFTINSIARNSITGELIDYFGGIKDIERKIIRVVGNNDRFNEDPLRMMRAIRFACELDFKLDIKIERPSRLKIISKERIKSELDKILATDKALYGWEKLCDTGLMKYIIPEFLELKGLKHGKNHIKDPYNHSLSVLEKGIKLNKSVAFRLACILHDIAKPETITEDTSGIHFYWHDSIGAEKAVKILRRLTYDNDTIDYVYVLIRHHMQPIIFHKEFVSGKVKKNSIIRLVRRVGKDNIYDLIDLVQCDIRSSKNPRHEFLARLKELVEDSLKEEPEKITSPIDGDEIMKITGLEPCKRVGELKKMLTNAVIDGKLGKEDKNKAIEMLKEEYFG